MKTESEGRGEETVLVVEDDPAVATVLRTSLAQEGIAAEWVGSAQEALRALELRPFDVILSDVMMPGVSGLELLAVLRRRSPDVPVLLLTAHGTVRMAVEAMKEGAMDFLTKPFDVDEVTALVRRALAVSARARRNVPSIPPSPTPAASCSPAMLHAEALLVRAARSSSTVVLLGESGVGKEVAARLLHAQSARASKPFVAVHCGALPENLLESELFGYERGAFTGAASRKPGRLELADGGTLLLDEIGEMSPAVQVKILRVLQERAFERLGGVTTIRVDVRFVAATHRDLPSMVASGAFREDLYYRLDVCRIRVPPLRERPEDIGPLAEHFARVHAPAPEVMRFDRDALDLLRKQAWPGNVRELQNFVERVVLFSDAPVIGRAAVLEHLSGATAPGHVSGAEPGDAGDDTLGSRRREVEREAVLHALSRSAGNRTQAARLLGVSRRTLYNKLAAFGLA